MNILSGEVWGLIPARGGSKSIPLKNLVPLGGRPLIDYVILAGQASGHLSRLVCSTEEPRIAARCRSLGVEVQERPRELAEDNVPTPKVIIHFLRTILNQEGRLPEILVLFEPTSPFVLPEHINRCVELLLADATAHSCQTIAPVPHNHHAYNQRRLKKGFVRFSFPRRREHLFNKQLKPPFYVFGNVRAFRTKPTLETEDIHGERSLPHIIPRAYALDVDGPDDVEWAECLLQAGLVKLNHLERDKR